jgi:S-methylmethionine-dependent homocysteine/selenocysteine methylase
MEAPELVRKAHEMFAAAGSDILTTSNYAVVPFHLGKERFITDGARLTALSGQLARQAASGYGCKVAGAIPPLFGSYRPDLFIAEQALPLLKIIIDALSPHVDFWLAETLSSIGEAEAVIEALAGDTRPLWLSFTLLDAIELLGTTPRLRSNQEVASAVNFAVGSGAGAILFNCSQPEAMTPAIAAAMQVVERLTTNLPIGVYANALPPFQEDALANATLHDIRQDLDPSGYLAFANSWCRLGATIIGGCCGIGPEHIAALRQNIQLP